MKYQLVVVAAFIALFGSTRSAPRAPADDERKKGADESQPDYQSEEYRAMVDHVKGRMKAGVVLNSLTQEAYNLKGQELMECWDEMNSLIAAASPNFQQEAAPYQTMSNSLRDGLVQGGDLTMDNYNKKVGELLKCRRDRMTFVAAASPDYQYNVASSSLKAGKVPLSKGAYDLKGLELIQCERDVASLLASDRVDIQQAFAKGSAEELPPSCTMIASSGPCRSYEQRYFYNKISGSCEKFTYGGCGGNYNNFKSKSSCEITCKVADNSQSDYQNDESLLAAVKGGDNPTPITQEVYDEQTVTLEECREKRNALLAVASSGTQKEAADEGGKSVCSTKPDTGPCRSYEQRFYYDDESENCKRFTYGGCGGNSNNFRARVDCQRSCKPDCSQPVNLGYCGGQFPRYFYSSYTGKCEFFFYGGCGGNTNHFRTREDCEAHC